MHTNKINRKKYIGITSRDDPEKRWGKDGSHYNDSPLFWNAIQKYGWEQFDHEILLSNLTEQEACEKEIELIKQYDTMNRDKGYNTLPGGNKPPVTYGKDNPFYGDHRFAGKNHPMYGKKHTDEAKRKMSERHWDASGSNNPFFGDHRFAGGNHPNAKAVICVETGITYETITEAEKQTGIWRQNIRKAISGRLHTAGGYHWKDADNCA